MPEIIGSSSRDNDKVLMDIMGWKGWNSHPYPMDISSALTSGTTRYCVIPFRAGDVVSNMYTMVTGTASGVTLIKLGLYDLSGNRLATSASVTTLFDATGMSTAVPMVTPYTVTSNQLLFGAVLVVASGAGNVGGWTSIAGKNGPSNAPVTVGGTEAGQTDLDTTATITTSGVGVFFAWS